MLVLSKEEVEKVLSEIKEILTENYNRKINKKKRKRKTRINIDDENVEEEEFRYLGAKSRQMEGV